MSIIVQKFGGTSVADVDCLKRVAQRISSACQEGHQVVAVVSAMGKTTDNLVQLARDIHTEPNSREFDMLLSTGEQISVAALAMALHAIGVDAVSMTGAQAGIQTDAVHTKAKIKAIQPERIIENLKANKVVIVAGFQGINSSQDIVTLGRGGSDLSAAALASAVGAERCQIFTDVEGVYTADPRVVKTAKKLDEIAYDEMLELASLGAKVLQSRSVEFAKKYGVEIEVLSSFSDAPGTIVKEEVTDMEDVLVRGVAADKNQAKVTVQALPDKPGVAAELFEKIAAASVNVDMIVQNVSEEGSTDLSFTVPKDDLSKAHQLIEKLSQDLGAKGATYDENIAKVSIVGVGMRSHAGVASKMFSILAKNSINIEMISTSEIKVSVVIASDEADRAVQELHAAFLGS